MCFHSQDGVVGEVPGPDDGMCATGQILLLAYMLHNGLEHESLRYPVMQLCVSVTLSNSHIVPQSDVREGPALASSHSHSLPIYLNSALQQLSSTPTAFYTSHITHECFAILSTGGLAAACCCASPVASTVSRSLINSTYEPAAFGRRPCGPRWDVRSARQQGVWRVECGPCYVLVSTVLPFTVLNVATWHATEVLQCGNPTSSSNSVGLASAVALMPGVFIRAAVDTAGWTRTWQQVGDCQMICAS